MPSRRSAIRLLRGVVGSVPADDRAAVERELERIEASAVEPARLRLAHLVWSGAVMVDDAEQAEIDAVLAGDVANAPGRIDYWRTRAMHPLADGSVRELCDLVVRLYEAGADD